MMIIESVEQNSKKGYFMPLKRKSPKGTFGQRVRECREENTDYTQEDFTKVLEVRYGITMSAAAFSKIELGETRRLDPRLIIAIADIAVTTICYLITGEERGETVSYSAEAEQVARMIDDMRPSTRQTMIMVATAALKLENELLQEMAQMLMDDVSHLDTEVRRRLDCYIDRMGADFRPKRQ